MRSPANARFHAAIFSSTDPTATCELLVGGTIADIEANVPKGGAWRPVPPNVHRAADVPPLGQLPVPVIPVAVPVTPFVWPKPEKPEATVSPQANPAPPETEKAKS